MEMVTLRSHQVFVCFARKDREEIEDVEKKILICVWHRTDEFLVGRDDHVLIVWRFRQDDKNSGHKTRTNRISELP